MDQKQLEIELKKISTQQTQWHDEFIQRNKEYSQRDKHWEFQRMIWVITLTVAITATAVKVFLL